MNDQETRTLDTFKRVRNFDVTHEGLFPAGTLARELFDSIAGSVNDIEAQAATESSGRSSTRQGTTGKGASRAAILEGLSIIRRTARSVAVVIPGLEDKCRRKLLIAINSQLRPPQPGQYHPRERVGLCDALVTYSQGPPATAGGTDLIYGAGRTLARRL